MFGRPVGFAGGLTFNQSDGSLIVTKIDGWESTAKPMSVLVGSGGAGAAASGLWLPSERYLTLTGVVRGAYDTQATVRAALLAAVPAGRETALTVYGWPGQDDLQGFVRLYDRADFGFTPGWMDFTLPLVMTDPYKYGLASLAGAVGVFTGQTWFRTYTYDSGSSRWVRSYTYDSGSTRWVRSYQQAADTGLYPQSLTLESGGDASSQRVTFTVTGPLDLGDWWLLNEATGQRLWAQIALDDGQTITFDCTRKLATLDGADVSSRVYGTWLTLEPGSNTYRLVAGSQSAAYASVSALEAYL